MASDLLAQFLHFLNIFQFIVALQEGLGLMKACLLLANSILIFVFLVWTKIQAGLICIAVCLFCRFSLLYSLELSLIFVNWWIKVCKILVVQQMIVKLTDFEAFFLQEVRKFLIIFLIKRRILNCIIDIRTCIIRNLSSSLNFG